MQAKFMKNVFIVFTLLTLSSDITVQQFFTTEKRQTFCRDKLKMKPTSCLDIQIRY